VATGGYRGQKLAKTYNKLSITRGGVTGFGKT